MTYIQYSVYCTLLIDKIVPSASLSVREQGWRIRRDREGDL